MVRSGIRHDSEPTQVSNRNGAAEITSPPTPPPRPASNPSLAGYGILAPSRYPIHRPGWFKNPPCSFVGESDASFAISRTLAQLPIDRDQMYIVSGPFPGQQGNGFLAAYPIPRGATVIATPSWGAPICPWFPAGHVTPPNLDPKAAPFYPERPANSGTAAQPAKNERPKGIRSPSAMVWNVTSPEGQLIPLRQMQPPVYFYQNKSEEEEDSSHIAHLQAPTPPIDNCRSAQ